MSRPHPAERRPNRLAGETSPYLLQHAYNPVDWYPWGTDAIERARAEDRPILLSIGYSACHWCHVMERESFEDPEIAGLMNEHYVNVKVDREERPDLDEIYMAATLALNSGQGGWPMTVILTPALKPVFAGTYFPPTDAYGRPGFPTLLRAVARAWKEDRERLEEGAGRLTDFLRTQQEPAPAEEIGEAEMSALLAHCEASFDPEFGGFGPAPKFPPARTISLLLRLHRRTGSESGLRMAVETLRGMAAGGMYDVLGGGFARYSTDRRWLVPHFEKMLYDNALLVKAYLEAYQVTGSPEFAAVARRTLDYVLREMTSPEGGFYSSTDADSEGEEGKFFVWTLAEIREILGPEEAHPFCLYYGVSDGGNWEGASILQAQRPIEDVAAELGEPPDELARRLERARSRLFLARARRTPAALDDKVLTAWNGLMIGSLAEGHRVLGEERYLLAASGAADFVLSRLSPRGERLYRTYRDGTAHLSGYLEDYAYLAEGLLDLYETSGSERYLEAAASFAQTVLDHFTDGGEPPFFTTAADHEEILVRFREGNDGATPSPNAVAATVLARLSHHLDRPDWRVAAREAVSAYGSLIRRHPRAFAQSLLAVEFLSSPPAEVALVGRSGAEDYREMRARLARVFLPHRILAVGDPDHTSDLPLLRGKGARDGRATLYLCRNFACERPVTDPEEVDRLLAGA